MTDETGETHVHDTCVHIVGRDGDVTLDFKHTFDRDGGRFLGRFIAFEPRFESQNSMYAHGQVPTLGASHPPRTDRRIFCQQQTHRTKQFQERP